VVSEVFTVEELDGVQDKGSADTTMVNVETLTKTFVKKKTSGLGIFLVKCCSVRICGVSVSRLKEFYCIYYTQ
jgi:hypothetical protein